MVKSAFAGSEGRPRPIPTAAWISGAVTIGLAATGVVVGMAAVQARNAYDAENDGLHLTQASSDKNRGQMLNTIADGFMGGAVLGALLTSYFVLSRPSVDRPSSAARLLPPLVPRVATTPIWGAAGIGGNVAATWTY
jgi:hypothetical protein